MNASRSRVKIDTLKYTAAPTAPMEQTTKAPNKKPSMEYASITAMERVFFRLHRALLGGDRQDVPFFIPRDVVQLARLLLLQVLSGQLCPILHVDHLDAVVPDARDPLRARTVRQIVQPAFAVLEKPGAELLPPDLVDSRADDNHEAGREGRHDVPIRKPRVCHDVPVLGLEGQLQRIVLLGGVVQQNRLALHVHADYAILVELLPPKGHIQRPALHLHLNRKGKPCRLDARARQKSKPHLI
eukprot:scaffold1610_cov257-Pinguiococcus_pyrenoidosus.AAC.33